MCITHVLIGSPVCQDPVILQEYLLSLMNLDIRGIKADFFFIDDNTEQKSKELLKNFKIGDSSIDILDMKNKHEYVRTQVTHKWENEQIWKVAEYRNLILSRAKQKGYDYVFMVDSDLLLHPRTLKHLIEQDKEIISEIFWTMWAPGGQLLPQVWLYDNYTLYEVDENGVLTDEKKKQRTAKFINMLKIPGVYKVGGLGACTLISRKALEGGVSYSRIPNLTFRGEDRHFCTRALAMGFNLYVDTHYPAYHIYRKTDLKGVSQFKTKCGYSLS